MEIIFCILLFFVGACLASFLNVVEFRGKIGEQFLKGRSRCPSCGNTIKPYDLIPVLSWIFLGGRCRSCGSKISVRYFLVELITGGLFVFAYTTLGLSVELCLALPLFALLVVIIFSDIYDMEVPYWCSIGIGVLGIISFFTNPVMPWYEHLIGAAIIAVPFAILAIFGAMGGGDVHLMAAAGLLLGWKIIPAAAIGIVTGAIFAIIAKLVLKRKEIMFAPFLSLGIIICYPFGQQIIDWYLNFLK